MGACGMLELLFNPSCCGFLAVSETFLTKITINSFYINIYFIWEICFSMTGRARHVGPKSNTAKILRSRVCHALPISEKMQFP
jgi:hypothetical protein